MNKKVIIQGSARSTGNTNKIATFIGKKVDADIIDLKTKNISGFDYDLKNIDDDFIPLMREIVDNYDTIIFATPVYWYSMSGIMKTFFDRIFDCIRVEKQIGLKLKGKRMGLVSCGSGNGLKEGFTMPFVESANYLGMDYLGDVHTWFEDDTIPVSVQEGLNTFIEIFKN